MDGDALKKVRSGDALDIPAAAYNAFVDAAEWARRQNQTGDGGRVSAFPLGIVLVKNNSGSDVPRFRALGIDDILIAPDVNEPEFLNRWALKVITPTGDHEGKFVITQEAIPAGKYGRAMVAGITVASVSFAAATGTPPYCDVAAGNTVLQGGYGSAQVLYRKEGSGGQYAVIRLGNGMGWLRVELTLSGGTNGSGTSQPSYSYVPRKYIIGAPGTGAVLSGAQQPEYRSQQFGTVQPPSGPILGWGYWGTDGQFHIASADEVWQVRNDCGTA